MKPSKDTQKTQQTPFEKASISRIDRNVLITSYTLTLKVIAESIKASGIIDKHASDVLAAIAQETESRLGISA